ncbi:MAG: DUF1559 domain-containing protein, partial [Planctomycetaceae bacterium]|nr:DUF1559 domain-containing protein [Planctomycetaceae bacterium]
ISEAVVSGTLKSRSIKGGISNKPDNAHFATPAECLARIDSANPKQLAGTLDDIVAEPQRGGYWSDGRAGWTGFITSYPPNSPNCGSGMTGYFAAQSFHTGGVNVGVMDGSCTFISDTINCEGRNVRLITELKNAYADPASRPSPHGVWGALGTKNCGESVAFP